MVTMAFLGRTFYLFQGHETTRPVEFYPKETMRLSERPAQPSAWYWDAVPADAPRAGSPGMVGYGLGSGEHPTYEDALLDLVDKLGQYEGSRHAGHECDARCAEREAVFLAEMERVLGPLPQD